MKRSRFSEEHIVYAIGQAESGTPVGDVCRQLGIAEQTSYAWKKIRASGRERTPPAAAGGKRRTSGSNGLWQISRSTNTCCRRPCEKTSKARTPSRTGRVVSGHVSGQLPAGLSQFSWAAWYRRSRAKDQRINRCSACVFERSPRPARAFVTSGSGACCDESLAREPEASPAVLPAGWTSVADAGAAAQAQGLASRPRADADRPLRALEYGCCASDARRWAAISNFDGRR